MIHFWRGIFGARKLCNCHKKMNNEGNHFYTGAQVDKIANLMMEIFE